jgi:hypothetical protein
MSHRPAWAGCMVSLTTATSSVFSVPSSVSSRSFDEKA